MSLYKIIFVLGVIFFSSEIFAKNVYYKAKQSINYKEKIDKAYLQAFEGVAPTICASFDIAGFDDKEYAIVATHYIARGSLVCAKDIRKVKIEYVTFNFGTISFRRQGRIISETKQYVKIKTIDGKIIKIYKDGRVSK